MIASVNLLDRLYQVQPIPFYPFYLSAAGVEYQTMPWFSVQLIRRTELAAARDEWCAMIGVSAEEYDKGEGEKDSRVADFQCLGVGLATLAEGRKAVVCSHPLDPKSTQSLHQAGPQHN